MRFFKALQVPDLDDEVAIKLRQLLENVCGVEEFSILPESRQVYVAFNDNLLPIQMLGKILAEAGCPLSKMQAVLIQ